MMENDFVVVKKLHVATYLIGLGHKFLRTEPNREDENYKVFVFEYDTTIFNDIHSLRELKILER